jgi:uncharacterized repeat protein (TIGR01451 family)
MAIFTNQATLSYRNNVVTSNVVTGTIVEVLSATKNALIDTYTVGDTITYVISISNSGSSAMTGVNVTDDLGAYTFGATTLVPLTYVDGSLAYYINGVLQPTPKVVGAPALTVSNLTIPAGGNAILVYEATVNEFAPLAAGGEITNTATVTSGNELVTASETVTVRNAPLLSITKGLSPTTVSENGQLTYTFTLQNFGNTEAVATDNVVVSDTFDPALENITVVYNGDTLVPNVDYTYDQATGVFATVPGRITVPAATFVQDPVSGEWVISPGVSTLAVTGTI